MPTNLPNLPIISATALLKPVRRTILTNRMLENLTGDPIVDGAPDIANSVSARMGHALHDSMENAITNNYASSMEALGYPKSVIKRIAINPPIEEALNNPDMIPLWMEQRFYKVFDGVIITGQSDLNFNWNLKDLKSSSVWSFMGDNKDDDYQKQLSIYRWLDPRYVRSDVATIEFIFTDWQRGMVKSNPNYPQDRVATQTVPLLSELDTERFIKKRLDLLRANAKLPEPQIVHCTDKELWRSDTVYKYFSKPTNKRSSKNFTSAVAANTHLQQKGKGLIRKVIGEPKACGYCDAFRICSQKDRYI